MIKKAFFIKKLTERKKNQIIAFKKTIITISSYKKAQFPVISSPMKAESPLKK